MSRIPIHELRRMGVSREDIEAAQITQEAQRRTGAPVQSIGVIVGAAKPRTRHNPNPPVSLTDRALRKRGTYDQAAMLLDQQALQESSPERAVIARQAAKLAKAMRNTKLLKFCSASQPISAASTRPSATIVALCMPDPSISPSSATMQGALHLPMVRPFPSFASTVRRL